MVKKRSVLITILLTIFTLGIYPIIMKCIIGHEVNRICKGDGKHNMHYLLALLLGSVTFSIYTIHWNAKAMRRLQDNAYRYSSLPSPRFSGSNYILWFYLGALIGIGPFVAECHLIRDVNEFAGVTANTPRLPYISNRNQRNEYLLSLRNDPNAAFENKAPAPQLPPQQNAPAPQLPPQKSAPVQNVAPQQKTQPVSYAQAVPVPAPKPAPVKSSLQNSNGSIVCIKGMYEGGVFPIMKYEEIVIGKDPAQCHIIITENGDYVGQKHCSIRYNDVEKTFLVANYSSNGTFTLDDKRIEMGLPTVVPSGTEIYIGTRENIFRLG